MDFSRYVTNLLNELNLYVLPQYLWLVITYYLTINVTYEYFLHIFRDEKEVIEKIPSEVLNINQVIMSEIDKWLPFVWFLAIAFLFSGICIGLIQHIPFLSKKRVSIHGDYGLTLGIWLLLIAFTIEIYHFSGKFFPLFLLVTAFIKLGVEEYKEKKKITYTY